MMPYPPIQEILYKTRTTVGSSVMSWNRAYSLFALPTFIQHKNYPLHPHDDWKIEEATRYYSEKGWHVQGPKFPKEVGCGHPF